MTYIREYLKPNLSRHFTPLTASVLNWITLKIRQMSAEAELVRLNDHLLKDIGLTRDDIDRPEKKRINKGHW